MIRSVVPVLVAALLAACADSSTMPPGVSDAGFAEKRIGAADVDRVGRNNVVWQNEAGEVFAWSVNGNTILGATRLGQVAPDARLVESSGDYDGDGRTDLLIRDQSGRLVMWRTNAGAPPTVLEVAAVPLEWMLIDGSGDYNGDGRSDLLWRNARGTVAVWLMNGATIAAAGFPASVPGDWSIADGTGDYDGDGRSDVLWRNAAGFVAMWRMSGTALLGTTFLPSAGMEWQIVSGSGDYNGDGRSDVLWRNMTTGQVLAWMMSGAGVTAGSLIGTAGLEWSIHEASGDYNGDRQSDILWRNANGDVLGWFVVDGRLAASGGFGRVGGEWSTAATTSTATAAWRDYTIIQGINDAGELLGLEPGSRTRLRVLDSGVSRSTTARSLWLETGTDVAPAADGSFTSPVARVYYVKGTTLHTMDLRRSSPDYGRPVALPSDLGVCGLVRSKMRSGAGTASTNVVVHLTQSQANCSSGRVFGVYSAATNRMVRTAIVDNTRGDENEEVFPVYDRLTEGPLFIGWIIRRSGITYRLSPDGANVGTLDWPNSRYTRFFHSSAGYLLEYTDSIRFAPEPAAFITGTLLDPPGLLDFTYAGSARGDLFYIVEPAPSDTVQRVVRIRGDGASAATDFWQVERSGGAFIRPVGMTQRHAFFVEAVAAPGESRLWAIDLDTRTPKLVDQTIDSVYRVWTVIASSPDRTIVLRTNAQGGGPLARAIVLSPDADVQFVRDRVTFHGLAAPGFYKVSRDFDSIYTRDARFVYSVVPGEFRVIPLSANGPDTVVATFPTPNVSLTIAPGSLGEFTLGGAQSRSVWLYLDRPDSQATIQGLVR